MAVLLLVAAEVKEAEEEEGERSDLARSLYMATRWVGRLIAKQFFLPPVGAGIGRVYRQFLNQDTPERLAAGLDHMHRPTMSADGDWFLYGIAGKPTDPSSDISVMRVPVAGGPAQFSFMARPHSQILCAWSPWNRCLIGEPIQNRTQNHLFGL